MDRADKLRGMQICRFCLADESLTNIYERNPKDKHSVPLPLQIMACIAIEVFANDGMPQLICNVCKNLTMQAYTFKTNAKKADDALKIFLATGQLNKPHMKSVHLPEKDRLPNPEKNFRKIFKQAEAVKPQQPHQQQVQVQPHITSVVKVEKGEVVTLNFDQNSGEQIITDDTQEEEILGMDMDDEENSQDESYEDEDTKGNAKLIKTDIYPCPHCERSFPLQQLLDLHVVNHDRQRLHQCDMCERRFFTKYDLNKHTQTHLGDKPFECAMCEKTFSREPLLRRHEKVHASAAKHVCTECDKTFITQNSLNMHMEKHNKKRPYVCNKCNKSFVFKQGLERHELIHSENKPHKCNYCEASFNSAIKLTRHITTHAGLRPYPCKLCGRTFLLSHHLTRHMRSHYAAMSSTPEKCIGEHKCDICSMSFRRKDFLINHSAIHSMVNLRCVICNTSFENAKLVKEHIATHLSDLPYPCEKCDYSFSSQDQLEEHELKHAEMEYEEQIEKEVIAEAKKGEEYDEDDAVINDEEYEDQEIDEFTLTNDINDPEVVRREKKKGHVIEFLKDEENTDEEEEEAHNPEDEVEEYEVVEERLKPIVRTEGTKVYTRKSTQRKPPPMTREISTALTSMGQISDQSLLDIQHGAINQLPNKGIMNMKMGDKVVRVQKYIVTKEEMKAMAKKGVLEMKGGNVLFRTPGRQSLSATLKSISQDDLEAIIDNKRSNKKTYQRKISTEENIVENAIDDTFSEDINFGESTGNMSLDGVDLN